MDFVQHQESWLKKSGVRSSDRSVYDPIHSTWVSSDAWWVPSSIQFVLLLDHYPPVFFGLSGWIHQPFLDRSIHTPNHFPGKQRQFEMWFTAKNCILGHLRGDYLAVSQALFSICFVLNQSHMGAGVTIMVSKWLQKNGWHSTFMIFYDQWECQDPKLDPKEKQYFAENIPWNLAQKYKPCSYLPLKNTGTWNGHWWNIYWNQPAAWRDNGKHGLIILIRRATVRFCCLLSHHRLSQ